MTGLLCQIFTELNSPGCSDRDYPCENFWWFFEMEFWFSLWNNGLREAVVSDAFLFLSTFFIQVLRVYYLSEF
jgi:hypothetical protein